jgi:hypothetical protein
VVLLIEASAVGVAARLDDVLAKVEETEETIGSCITSFDDEF